MGCEHCGAKEIPPNTCPKGYIFGFHCHKGKNRDCDECPTKYYLKCAEESRRLKKEKEEDAQNMAG